MEPFIGQIMLFGGLFVPSGWASCDGQLLAIRDYQALFSLLGTTYGGDGQTTFAVPNLNGRVPVGGGAGPGLSARAMGESGGAATVALTTSHLPIHTHSLRASSAAGDAVPPTGAHLAAGAYSTAASSTTLAADSLSTAGGGLPVATQMPVLTSLWCIALDGIYPSRS